MTRHFAILVALSLGALAAGCGDGSDSEPGLEVEQKNFSPQCPSSAGDGVPFVADVVSIDVGEGGGFNLDAVPEVVSGVPVGSGTSAGSADVVSLGAGGEIVVMLGADAVDCDGPDFVVFENSFDYGAETYYELGRVSVSFDGSNWTSFGCDPGAGYPFDGCAGVAVVMSSPANDLDPRDPAVSGGDEFDLADVGLDRIRFVKIEDLDVRNGGPGDEGKRGFDLDAIAIVDGHAESFDYRP